MKRLRCGRLAACRHDEVVKTTSSGCAQTAGKMSMPSFLQVLKVAKLAIRAFLNPGRGENVRFVLLARFLVAYDVEISEPAFRSPL